MVSFGRPAGAQPGRPTAFGATRTNPAAARSSPSTKASMSRTGSSGPTWSSTASGSSSIRARPAPAMGPMPQSTVGDPRPEPRAGRSLHTVCLQAAAMHADGRLPATPYVPFVMGVRNAMPADRDVFNVHIATMRRLFGAGA